MMKYDIENGGMTMTTYWDEAMLGDFDLQYSVNKNDGKSERMQKRGLIPDDGDDLELLVSRDKYVFRIRCGELIAVKNGQDFHIPEDGEIKKFIPVAELMYLKGNAFQKEKLLSEGILKVLQDGVDYEEYLTRPAA